MDFRGSSILVGERDSDSFSTSSRGGGGEVSRGGGGEVGGGGGNVLGRGTSVTDGAMLDASSSRTVDCRFALFSSSSSSAISPKRRRRKELLEDDVDPEAVCSEHAAESSGSRSSLDEVIGKMVSVGEKRSETAVKWTEERAEDGQVWTAGGECERESKFLTFNQP